MAAHGEIHREHAKNDEYILRLKETGLLAFFARRDVTTLKPSDITGYLSHVPYFEKLFRGIMLVLRYCRRRSLRESR